MVSNSHATGICPTARPSAGAVERRGAGLPVRLSAGWSGVRGGSAGGGVWCGRAPYILLRVFPLANACSTPRGPSVPSPPVDTLAIRRAVPLRWLDEAK